GIHVAAALEPDACRSAVVAVLVARQPAPAVAIRLAPRAADLGTRVDLVAPQDAGRSAGEQRPVATELPVVAKQTEPLVVLAGAPQVESSGAAPGRSSGVVDADPGGAGGLAAAPDRRHSLGRGIEAQAVAEGPAVAEPDRRLRASPVDRVAQAVLAEDAPGPGFLRGESDHGGVPLLGGVEGVGTRERRDQLVTRVDSRALGDAQIAAQLGAVLVGLPQVLLELSEPRGAPERGAPQSGAQR